MSVWTSANLLFLLGHFIIKGGSSAECPAVDPDHLGICAFMCSPQAESSCPSGQLCCSNGCGFSCVDPAPQNAEKEWDQLCPQKTDLDKVIGCSENTCPMMKCNNRCCFDGCNSYCVYVTTPAITGAPVTDGAIASTANSFCPWAEKQTGGLGCSENMCYVMRCKGQCCYDGCKSFCKEDVETKTSAAIRLPESVPCPMAIEKPRSVFGCSENKCPVMRCRLGCCYDGCQSFCRGFKDAKAERFSDYYDYDANYNNFVVSSSPRVCQSSMIITASVFLCIRTSFLTAFHF